MDAPHPSPVTGLARVVLGVSLVLVFHAIGVVFMNGWALDLGSLSLPAPRHATFMAAWAVVGTAAVVTIGWGLAERLPSGALRDGLLEGTDLRFVLMAAVAAVAIPTAIHHLVLRGAPVTDDESSYLFAAQLLAEGRLWMSSPEDKLFFDRAFLINDGRMYTQYFLGWPALLAPFAWAKQPWLANPVYAALTVPAVFFIGRRLGGGLGARLAVVAFVTSPMMMTAAATGMSHTAATLGLAWCTWAVLRSRDAEARWWVHAAVGGAFAAMFFVRPLSALGAGGPLLVWWGWGVARAEGRARLRSVAGFALPAAALAALFLLVNTLQNGSPTAVSYQRMVAYAAENGYRLTHLRADTDVAVAGFRWYGPVYSLATAGIASLRLSFALLGWPLALGLVALAGTSRGRALLHASWLGFFAVSLLQYESGVDAYAPVHYFEAGLPLLILVALGAQRLADSEALSAAGWLGSLPLALVAGGVLASGLGFWPVKMQALGRMADDINAPLDAAGELGRAVVFAPRPFATGCRSDPTRHWVYWRPHNPPAADPQVLWVNHITVPADRTFMRHHPARDGFVMVWTDGCELQMIPLDLADQVPDAELVR